TPYLPKLGEPSTSFPRRIHTVRPPATHRPGMPCETRLAKTPRWPTNTISPTPGCGMVTTTHPWCECGRALAGVRFLWEITEFSNGSCVNGLSAVACAHDPHAVPNRVTVGHGHAVPACGDGGGEQAAAEPGRIAHVPGERPAGQDPTTVMLAGQRFVCCAVDPQQMPAATGEDTEHDERRSGERAGGRVVHHHRAGARMAVATSRSVCNTCTRGR